MIYIGGLLNIGSLQEAISYIPILNKYYQKPVIDRIPILFAMYARYRGAELCFDDNGIVSGYSEPSLTKDSHLKELFIISVEYFQIDEVKKDIHDLWVSLQNSCFGSRNIDFPIVFSSYILNGFEADKYPQSTFEVTKEVTHYLQKVEAKNIFEITGKIGLVGDEYGGWTRYTEYLPDWKERYLDELLRSINENRSIIYSSDNYLEKDLLKIKDYDTIIVNLASSGGILSKEEQYIGIPSYVDKLLHLQSKRPGCACRQAILIFDYDFSKSGRFSAIRERLIFYGAVKDISFIDDRYLVMHLVLSGHNVAINYRVLHVTEENSQIESYALPLTVISKAGYVYDPVLISGKSDVSEENRTYLIALVGNPLTGNDYKYLEENHIKVMYDVPSLEGENGLKHILEEDSTRPLKTVNAVIMDAVTDYDENTPFKYEGLAQAEKLLSKQIPFFVYTNIQKKDLGPIADYAAPSLTCDENYFGRKDVESLSALVKSMKLKMDNISKPDATIRNKYEKELEAADWLDHSGEMTRQITKIMKDDICDDFTLEHTEDLLNGLRKCADAIFVSAREDYEILPPLEKLGEMHRFLSDKEFYDNKKRCLYVLDDTGLIQETLVASLGYFISMTNGASHAADSNNIDVCGYITKSKRAGVYRACAYILLDLLCWYKGAINKSTRKRYSVSTLYNDDDKVQKAICPGFGEYYFIGKLHLQYQNRLEEGLSGKDLQIFRVGKEQRKPNLPVLAGVKYYVDKRNYNINLKGASNTL